MQRFTVNIKLPARTLTGALSAPNRGAADWGWQGLIAYGCHSLVLIIDANTAQTLQVLERHKASVVKVKWAKENYHHNIGSPYSLRLASADVTGKIIVWDVATGTARCEIQEHTKPIQDMQWLWNQDASRDLLLAVHPPNYIVLWNADTGTKLWKKSYAENILSFSFDPFDPSHLALLTSEGIVFISDFSPSKAPASSGKKVYISSPHSSPSHNKLAAATGAKKALDKVKILISNEKPSAESVTLNDCLQLSYLPSKRNYMLLLYPREILILDLEVNQTVGVIAIERTGVPFLQVIPCFQRDGLFCLHENGCITLRVRRSNCSITGTPNEEPGLPLPPFAIRMCPPLTTKNIKQYEPILAVGTSNGSVLVFHLTSGLLHKELSIHSCEVKGIEWISLTGFISFATSTPNNLGLVRNELQLVDLPTGRSITFRGERGNDEPAIEMIKVSHLNLLQEAESKSELSQNISAREHFVFAAADGQVYHLTVEGNSVKDSARIPPDGSMGSITSIAWKGDILVLGDIDGNLNFWDLKARVSRGIPTHRSWVKKIRFAPGKGNQKLLAMYNDGAEIWDSKEVQMVSSLRSGRNINFRILDVDWCTSDKVVLASDDGCIRVLDLSMKPSCFRMDEQDSIEGVQLLCLIDKAADACRYLQTYGEWNRAAWLAKVRLNSEECADVLKRWVDHLCSPQVNQKSKAILVLLSLGCFTKVAEMLHSMRYFDRAALFVEACLKYGAFEVNDDTNILFLKSWCCICN
ncbi:WD repeat-containing protein 11 [Grus japonensis]|uniref:WD repeat-containing protein 11 n=1 Tax=Grus japonensis TaxID=30415 RepID=A0ABC9X4W4_GRUJA